LLRCERRFGLLACVFALALQTLRGLESLRRCAGSVQAACLGVDELAPLAARRRRRNALCEGDAADAREVCAPVVLAAKSVPNSTAHRTHRELRKSVGL
jgi:hypothetical protein